jgi:hypothetical protein
MSSPYQFFLGMRKLLDAAPALGQIADESRAQVLLEEFEARYPAIYADLVRCIDLSPELVVSTLAMSQGPEITMIKWVPRWESIIKGIQEVIKARESDRGKTTVRDRVRNTVDGEHRRKLKRGR